MPNRVLVAFHDSRVVTRFASSKYALKLADRQQSEYFSTFEITDPKKTVDQAIRELRADPSVRVAEPDFILSTMQTAPNDPLFGYLWGLYNQGQTGGTSGVDIRALNAWQITRGVGTVKVAVIDSGVDYTHPDLAQNILKSGTGQVVGVDTFNGDADPMDDNGHGTHCAGTIAARYNNAIGITGVAPNVKILPAKFIGGDGSGPTSSAIAAIDFSRKKGVKVMSNSWGGTAFSRLLLEAVQRTEAAGILFVAAAGNDGRNIDDAPAFPAGYGMFVNNVICVGASDHNDQIADFSNFGYAVDIAAPGVGIVSTYPGNDYKSLDGTSMATPHVSGVAALVASKYPMLPAVAIKDRVINGSQRIFGLRSIVNFERRLDAYNSLENDITAPAAPTLFKATRKSSSAVSYQFRTPGDDGNTGSVSYFDIRYSYAPISNANFDFAMPVDQWTTNWPAGQTFQFVVRDLLPLKKVYCAVRAVDNVGNRSAIAIAPEVTTAAAKFNDPVATAGNWILGGWGLSSEDPFIGTKSLTDSVDSYYLPNTVKAMTQKTALAATGPMILYFQANYQLETGYDFVSVQYSYNNGTSWIPIGTISGFSNWRPFTIMVPSLAGDQVKVRFVLVSDEMVEYEGIYLDEIRLVNAAFSLYDDASTNTKFTRQTPWNTTAASYTSSPRSWTDSPSALYQNNANRAITSASQLDARAMLPAFLGFTSAFDIEEGYDNLWVELSQNNGTSYFPYGRLTGSRPDWSLYMLDITNTNRLLRLRFRMITDGAGQYDGAYIDDIGLIGEPSTAL